MGRNIRCCPGVWSLGDELWDVKFRREKNLKQEFCPIHCMFKGYKGHFWRLLEKVDEREEQV